MTRRLIAGFLVFLFIAVSIPVFFIYALSRTYFAGDFYNGPVVEGSYDYLVSTLSERFYQADPVIQKHFSKSDLQKVVKDVFTRDLLAQMFKDFGRQLEQLKQRPDVPTTVSFKVLRDSLLTASHNLAFELFQNLPLCQARELPEVNTEGIPTCVPRNVDYANLSATLSKQFEKAVYTFLPEQAQIDLASPKTKNTPFYYIFLWIDQVKLYALVLMVVLLAMIALVLNNPVSLLVRYESLALFFSGILGFILSVVLPQGLAFLFTNVRDNTNSIFNLLGSQELFLNYVQYLFAFFAVEIQKIAVVFLILGGGLFFIQIVIKRRNFNDY